MKGVLRFVKIAFWTLLTIAIAVGSLLGYYLYTPDAEVPPLSGRFDRASIDVGGVTRNYRLYVPRTLARHAPLLLVMHGSGENGAQIRMETGYGFDRLADRHGFAVVYPDAHTFDWNDCSVVGDFVADGRPVDDVGFMTALADRLIVELGLDRDRVFATGVSAGGSMSLRLALEAPTRFRAVAAVSANLPAPGNFKCSPAGPGTSVLLMNGTRDPLVPFGGGEVSLLGLFYKGGDVLSARESGQYFATLNRIAGGPAASRIDTAGDGRVDRLVWRSGAGTEIELAAIVGGGHGMPQADWRRPRLLGRSPMAPDGPALIWKFFERPLHRRGVREAVARTP